MFTRRVDNTRAAMGPARTVRRRITACINWRLLGSGTQRVFTARIPVVRRLAAWLLIAEQVLVGAGVALPCPAAAAASHERFPCESCGCGCTTAEHCWRNCCCYTNQEKVAWARENGVAVPEYVAAAAEREQASASKPKCPHCAGRVGPEAGACSAPAGTGHDPRGAGNKTPRAAGLRWIDVARCHGAASYFEDAGPGWPPAPPAELTLTLPLVGRISRQPFLGNPTLPPAPPTPPPERV